MSHTLTFYYHLFGTSKYDCTEGTFFCAKDDTDSFPVINGYDTSGFFEGYHTTDKISEVMRASIKATINSFNDDDRWKPVEVWVNFHRCQNFHTFHGSPCVSNSRNDSSSTGGAYSYYDIGDKGGLTLGEGCKDVLFDPDVVKAIKSDKV